MIRSPLTDDEIRVLIAKTIVNTGQAIEVFTRVLRTANVEMSSEDSAVLNAIENRLLALFDEAMGPENE